MHNRDSHGWPASQPCGQTYCEAMNYMIAATKDLFIASHLN
jgi:hypothetical protein